MLGRPVSNLFKLTIARVRNLVSIILIVITCQNIGAQHVQWVKQSTAINSSIGARTLTMELDSHENTYVLLNLYGESEIAGQVFLPTSPFPVSTMLLLKLDPDGDLLWSKQFEVKAFGFGADIAIDPADNVLVTGSSAAGNTVFGQVVSANFIAKLNPMGNTEWLTEYGNADSALSDIESDSQGNVIVAGTTNENTDGVLRFSPQGVLEWITEVTYLSCCIGAVGQALKIDNQNNIIWAGAMLGRFSFDGAIIRADDPSVFYWKLDDGGNTIWLNISKSTALFSGDYNVAGMDIDQENNIYVTGDFQRSAQFGALQLIQTTGNNEGYVTKISPSGTFEWVKPIFTGEMYIYGLNLNRQTQQLYIYGEAIANIQYDNAFRIENVRPGFIITTSLLGDFMHYTGLYPETTGVAIRAVRMSASGALVVSGYFRNKLNIGCFEVNAVDGSWGSFIYKTGLLPEVYFAVPDRACVGSEFDISLVGTQLATSFSWELGTGLEPVGGSLLTPGNSTRLAATQINNSASIDVRPDFSCYPDIAFGTSIDIRDIPGQPATPTGESLVCLNAANIYSVEQVATADDYIWEVGGGLSIEPSSGGNPYEINLLMVGPSQGSIRVKSSNQCGESSYSDILMIDFHPPTPAVSIVGPSEICDGQVGVDYQATAQGVQRYGWQIPEGVGVVATNGDSTQVTLDMSKIHVPISIYALAKGICSNSISEPFPIGLIKKPNPPDSVIGPEQVCQRDKDVQYSATTDQSGVQFEWVLPKGFQLVEALNNVVQIDLTTDAESGLVEARISNECFASEPASIHIMVGQQPEVPEFVFERCENRLSYEGDLNFDWLLNDVLLNSIEPNFSISDSGYYKLKVNNFCGSAESEEIQIYPIVKDKIFIPNVITPDGNGKNDYFIIDRALTGSPISIYNRWGKSVYHSDHYSNNWSGLDLSDGTYFYQITHECLQIKGIVHLIR